MFISNKIQQIAYPMRGEKPPQGWFDPSGKLGSEVILNGADILSIKNSSSNVADVSYAIMEQTGGAAQPLYVASGINGLPSIRQTVGQNESLLSGNFFSGASVFLQFVFRPLSSNTATSNMMTVLKRLSPLDIWVLRLTPGLILEALTGNLFVPEVVTNIITASSALVIGTDYLIECRFDPPDNVHSIKVNGVIVASSTATNTVTPDVFAIVYPGASNLGDIGVVGNPPDIDGLYSELLVQNSVPPTPETDKRRRYLANRYNISIP